MPYRRLPNTDIARIKSLKAALDKGLELSPIDLAYSQQSLAKLKAFYNKFEQTVVSYRKAYEFQSGERSRDYQKKLKNTKLYISHFLQVMNLSILREDLPKSTREYFGIKEKSNKIPDFKTEASVIAWGEIVIEGERKRVSQGLNPITNPTSGVVRVYYDIFLVAYRSQKLLQNTTASMLSKVADLRDEANNIILDIWNETEKTYVNLSSQERRNICKEYGIIYYNRKEEDKEEITVYDNFTPSNETVDYSLPFSFR